MNRTPRTRGSAVTALAMWFVVCLFCQAYPATAQSHHGDSHGDSAELDHACFTVAETTPVLPSQVAVESKRTVDQPHAQVPAVSLPSGMLRSARSALQRDTPSVQYSAKLYQLNRVYRL